MNTSVGITTRRLASTSVDEESWIELQRQKQEDRNEQSAENEAEGSGSPSKPEQAETIAERSAEEDDTGVVDCDMNDPDASFDHSSDEDTMSTSSSSIASSSIASSRSDRAAPVRTSQQRHVSCIQEAQLSPDGRCIFTTDYDRAFSVYAVDDDILTETGTRPLTPYARFASADPIWAFAVDPYFNVNYRETTNVLVSRRDQYITLHNALWDASKTPEAQEAASKIGPVDISSKIASYKLVDHLTEKVQAPTSLAYSFWGDYFYAGHQNCISVFDINYTNGPILKIPTIPSARSNRKGGGVGFKGQVTALALYPYSFLSDHLDHFAAGTRTRYVGLYDGVSGKAVTHFGLPGKTQGEKLGYYNHRGLEEKAGDGITQMKYDPACTYLYIAERNSSAIYIYDVRNYAFCVGYLAGRNADTRQKMSFDIWKNENSNVGYEVWAGGTDGKVRFWRRPHAGYGAIEPDGVIDVSDGPVSASLVHPGGDMAVVASGKHEMEGGGELRGKARGGGLTEPSFREWGCLDILGLKEDKDKSVA